MFSGMPLKSMQQSALGIIYEIPCPKETLKDK